MRSGVCTDGDCRLYGLIAHNIQNAGAEVCLPLGIITMAVGIICAIAIKSKVNKNVDEINLKASEEKLN